MEEYLPGSFEGTRDLRVKEKARTLQVAVWLHHLDMAAAEDETASLSMAAAQYSIGPPLEYFLASKASNLMLEEVVQWVLVKNRLSMLYNKSLRLFVKVLVLCVYYIE